MNRAASVPDDGLRLRLVPDRTTEEVPLALRMQRRERRVRSDRRSRGLTCCVYCDETMLANGLLAVGSFLRFAPGGRGVLFVSGGGEISTSSLGVRHVEIVDSDVPLRAARIDVKHWAREHDGIAEHYFRKVAMWLYMLEQPVADAPAWYAFCDADVLFVRPVGPLFRHAKAHRLGAMVERWHQSLYSVYRQAPDAARLALGQLFHGHLQARQMQRTRYYNTGLMLCRRDERVSSAVKDVLIASMLYPQLTRQVRFPEQTLLNLAMMVRGVQCRDLYGLCVPSYHDEEQDWPPPVVRHYLGDFVNRRPEALRARHAEVVNQSLAAVGTSVSELEERGIWNATPAFSGAINAMAPYPFLSGPADTP